MPFVGASEAKIFDIPGAQFTGLAAPSKGAKENSVWKVLLQPGAPGVPHSVTREEIFVALAGRATAVLSGVEHEMTPGSVLIVPANVEFSLSNPHKSAFEAMVVLPVGGQAKLGTEPAFSPPWAQ